MAPTESRRLALEGLVIVGSILLAFSIDAAWDALGDRQRLLQLTSSLRADVEATQIAIRERSDRAQEIAADCQAMLNGIARGARGPELDSLVFSVGNVFVKGRWAPINHTYQQAISSGDLTLIEDSEARLLLGRYTEALNFVTAIQNASVTQYYGELEPFLVANTDYSQVAWVGEAANLVRGPFSTDAVALSSRRDFSNLLNLKLELELELADALATSARLADDLLTKLEGF